MLSKFRLLLTTIIITLSVFAAGCDNSSNFVSIEGEALGTFVQIKCSTNLSKQDIIQIIEEVDNESKNSMSIFSPSSLLSRINRNETDSLDSHIAYNIELARRFSELSDGAYDITIKPLTDAWGFGRTASSTKIDIDSLLEFVGYKMLNISDNRVIKEDSRIQIDLNSIAKGYTVDLIAQKLEALGIADYMVNIGGEIRCKGYNQRSEEWSIAIETPYEGNMAMDSFEKIISVTDRAVATSGNYRRFYTTAEGDKVVHTIDPKSGYSVISTLLSATVIAPTCAEADAAATMFMSLGASDKTTQLAEYCTKEYGWEYYFIYADGEEYRIVCSEGLK
ncbi:MAG: FAD:protein FMN transferase [Alistipes sp.]|nr:FAD:protein FMN transferase [Alistipes sp.]